jgi:transposase
MTLLSGAGMAAWAVAEEVGCDERTVRKWKARFRASPRVESLFDFERSGRPAKVALPVRCKVVQLACERPDGKYAPFRDVWTLKSLADATLAATGVELSVSEVGRILRFEKLRPHHVRQWLHSPDPAFAAKAEKVCDLYLNPPRGALVVSIDEKPVQVLGRKHPTHTGPDGEVRFEYEYIRRGTCAVLACFDVGSGEVLVDVVPHRTSEATVAFLEQLATLHPDREICVVWDNLNTHYDGKDRRWTLFNERHGGRFRFVYTPIHASWMNQVEVWFSILERRILKHGSFDDFEHVYATIMGFARYWNDAEAHPFRWTWRYVPAQNRTRLAA